MDVLTITLLLVIGAAALVLLYSSGMLRTPGRVCLAAALIAGAFILRGLCMGHVTLDYQDFLSRWVQFYRDNGGFAALGEPVGNYNLPYLYFLAAFSYIGANDLVLIKALSVVFDVVLAWAVMKLVGLYTGSDVRRLAAFFLTLYWPSVILNGSCWGQCDSIYVAFAVLALYLALNGRGAAGMVCMAVSFAFKLQAVFVMPIFVVLLIAKKVKLWHFLLFPLTYVVLMLPAVLMGYPLLGTVTLYFDQMGTVGSALNYNSSSVYAFFYNVEDPETASLLGIIAAFAAHVPVLPLGLEEALPARPRGHTRLRRHIRGRHPLPAAAYARPLLLRRRHPHARPRLRRAGIPRAARAHRVCEPPGLPRLPEAALPPPHALGRRRARPRPRRLARLYRRTALPRPEAHVAKKTLDKREIGAIITHALDMSA